MSEQIELLYQVIERLEGVDSGSTRQLDDVRSVLDTSELDERYLDRWAFELGVSESLARCRS